MNRPCATFESTAGLVRRRRRAVGDRHHERVAEQVVVERAEELREEEGQEPAGFEQRELRALGARHLFGQLHQAFFGLRRRSRLAALLCCITTSRLLSSVGELRRDLESGIHVRHRQIELLQADEHRGAIVVGAPVGAVELERAIAVSERFLPALERRVPGADVGMAGGLVASAGGLLETGEREAHAFLEAARFQRV